MLPGESEYRGKVFPQDIAIEQRHRSPPSSMTFTRSELAMVDLSGRKRRLLGSQPTAVGFPGCPLKSIHLML